MLKVYSNNKWKLDIFAVQTRKKIGHVFSHIKQIFYWLFTTVFKVQIFYANCY